MNTPKPDSSDIVQGVLKTSVIVAGTVLATEHPAPALAAGGMALITELFPLLPSSIQRRQDKWLQAIVYDLQILRQRFESFNPETIWENEHFVTVFLIATQKALRNHQKEKLLAFQNAVLNTAFSVSPDEDLQLLFLQWINDLTVRQIALIKYLNQPNGIEKEFNDPSLEEMVVDSIYIQLIRDLKDKSLITIDNVPPTASDIARATLGASRVERLFQAGSFKEAVEQMSLAPKSEDRRLKDFWLAVQVGVIESSTTELGKKFIEYIESPLKEVS